jgi:broad specificity polyphosphatase/5'/3'-nucleotidase SurE
MAGAFLGEPDDGLLVSVNVPDDTGPHTERRLTTIAQVGYDRLFREDERGTYVHDFGGGVNYREPLDGTDIQAALDGAIAVTPIRSPHAVDPAPGLLSRFCAREVR